MGLDLWGRLSTQVERRGTGQESPRGPALRVLQIETGALAVDEHEPGVDQLLPGRVVLLVGTKRGNTEDILDRQWAARFRRGGRRPYGGAEVDSVEIRVFLEVGHYRPDQAGDVFIERYGRRAVARSGRVRRDRSGQRELQVDSFVERDENRGSVANKPGGTVEVAYDAVERTLVLALQRLQSARGCIVH